MTILESTKIYHLSLFLRQKKIKGVIMPDKYRLRINNHKQSLLSSICVSNIKPKCVNDNNDDLYCSNL